MITKKRGDKYENDVKKRIFFSDVVCPGRLFNHDCAGDESGWISPQGRLVGEGTNSGNMEFSHLDEDMNYYYSGSASLPTAMVKLSKKYSLDGASWKQITGPEMLKAIMQYLKGNDGNARNHKVRSYTVKARDARPIGAWYSNQYVYGMRLNMSADNKLSISVLNPLTLSLEGANLEDKTGQ